MANWYTADTHFNHFNILAYCNRPFHTLAEMHKALIGNWNELVSKDDTVYFLGDFCFVYEKSGAAKKRSVLQWKEQLNGKIVLIQGNHDHKVTRKHFRPECYFELEQQIGKYNCILAHRPLYPDYWDIPTRDLTNHFARKAEYEKYDFVISGHVHNAYALIGKSLNVGVDIWEYKPVNEHEVHKILCKIEKEIKKGNLSENGCLRKTEFYTKIMEK